MIGGIHQATALWDGILEFCVPAAMEERKFADECKSSGESKFTDVKDGEEEEEEDCGWVLPGLGEDQSVVARAALWFGKKKNRGELQTLSDFAEENAHLFWDEVDDEEGRDGTGLKLEYEEYHRKYLVLFEAELEDFIAEEGFSMDDFERDCKAIRQGKPITLFEHEDHSWFLDALLSSLDFEHFFKTMVSVARKQAKSVRKK